MKNRFGKKVAFLVLFLGMALGVAFAVQTPLTPITPVGPYITGQPASSGLNFVFTASDASNGNSFPISGKEILLMQNTDSMAHTVTISSVPDQFNRTNDVTSYSIAAGDFSIFSFRGGVNGWRQTDGTVHLATNSAMIEFAVITTPN